MVGNTNVCDAFAIAIFITLSALCHETHMSRPTCLSVVSLGVVRIYSARVSYSGVNINGGWHGR